MTDSYEIRVPERSQLNMIGTRVYRNGEELKGVVAIEIIIANPFTVKARITWIDINEECAGGKHPEHIIEADNCVFTVQDHRGGLR